MSTRDEIVAEIMSYDGCITGDCPHEKQTECYRHLIESGYDAGQTSPEVMAMRDFVASVWISEFNAPEMREKAWQNAKKLVEAFDRATSGEASE